MQGPTVIREIVLANGHLGGNGQDVLVLTTVVLTIADRDCKNNRGLGMMVTLGIMGRDVLIKEDNLVTIVKLKQV